MSIFTFSERRRVFSANNVNVDYIFYKGGVSFLQYGKADYIFCTGEISCLSIYKGGLYVLYS